MFANTKINAAVPGNGLFYGETKLFMVQLLAMIGVSVFAFFGTFVLLKITDLIMPLRVSEIEEQEGLDWSQHEERL